MWSRPHSPQPIALDQPLRHEMPVGVVEELLLHMVVPAGSWWLRRVFVVEDQLRRPVIARLKEAHHLAILERLPVRWRFAANLGEDARCHHFGLEVRRRAALGHRQVGGIAQRVHAPQALDL